MYWDDSEPLLFHVVEKATGKIHPVKYEADPMGFFHMINAYEEDNFIVLDAPFKSSPVSYNVFQVKPLSGTINWIHFRTLWSKLYRTIVETTSCK